MLKNIFKIWLRWSQNQFSKSKYDPNLKKMLKNINLAPKAVSNPLVNSDSHEPAHINCIRNLVNAIYSAKSFLHLYDPNRNKIKKVGLMSSSYSSKHVV